MLIGEALGACRSRVRMDAVAAAVRCGYRDIDQLFCERIEDTGLKHYLFDARPCSLKEVGLIRKSTPEIVHKIRFARGAYIVEYGLDRWDSCGFLIGPELYSSHLIVLQLES